MYLYRSACIIFKERLCIYRLDGHATYDSGIKIHIVCEAFNYGSSDNTFTDSCMYYAIYYISVTAPSAPVNVTVTEVGSTYVFIIWESPEFPNGIIQNYIVLVTGSDGESVSNISTSDLSTNVTNLLPFTPYFVEVFAETVEVGVASDSISFNTTEAVSLTKLEIMTDYGKGDRA